MKHIVATLALWLFVIGILYLIFAIPNGWDGTTWHWVVQVLFMFLAVNCLESIGKTVDKRL